MVEDEKRHGGGVVDHLQAPRKKKKDYVVLAFGAQFDRDLATTIENHVRLNFKGYTTVRPKNAADLQRLFVRQVVLLLIEDTFSGREETMKLVRALKERKNKTAVPVVFFTENPDELVSAYNTSLVAYQEVDTFVNFRQNPINQILAKIGKALTEKSVRRSRRYSVDIPVTYFHLTKNKEFSGRLIDMSVHGAILKDSNNELFRNSDQLRINIPFGKFLAGHDGDFLKVSARVRRVFIDARQVGISWEYLSPHQLFLITSYLTEMVNDEMQRKFIKQRTTAALAAQRK